MIGYIYYIINKIDGKRYVGQTLHFDIRRKTHLNNLIKNKHHSSKLQRAWNKYGESNFYFEVKEVQIKHIEELYQLEQEEIKKYDSYFNGYNMTIGGEGVIRKYYTFEQYCFIYFGNSVFEGMMNKTARYFGVDSSVISDILNKRTYLEYAELLDNISEEEKKSYINEFITKFGIDIDNPPKILNKQKVDYKILAICLCIIFKYDNVGKSLERILGYSKGTMSALKLRKRYNEAWKIYETYSIEERESKAQYYYNEWKVEEEKVFKAASRGNGRLDSKAILITQENLNKIYAAKELGYGYTCLALYYNLKPATVKDWLSGRSRKTNLEKYNQLSDEQKEAIKNLLPLYDFQKLENQKEKSNRLIFEQAAVLKSRN